MRNLIKYIVLTLTIFIANYANSASVFPNLPSINFTSPTTDDFIVADISGDYSTPGFALNASPTVDIGIGSINITFDVSSPTGPQPDVLDPFNYSVNVGQLSMGDWYLTPIFYVDGVFDNALFTTLPLFTVTAVPIPPAVWLFGSGLLGLVGIARRRRKTSPPLQRQQQPQRSRSPLRGLFHRHS
jgi:hypothetical protein